MLHCFRKLTIISIVFLAAILLFILPGCSRQNDLTGTWKGKITLPQTGKSITDLEFSLTQKGKEVTGMMIFTKLDAKLPLTGTVADGKVTLLSPLKNGLSVSISGILESRRLMKGNAILVYSTAQLGKRQDNTILELTR